MRGRTSRVQIRLLTMLTEPAFGEVNEFRSALGVLYLHHVDFVRADACDLERLACSINARRRSDLEFKRGAEHLE